jgi:hypothetical protein
MCGLFLSLSVIESGGVEQWKSPVRFHAMEMVLDRALIEQHPI